MSFIKKFSYIKLREDEVVEYIDEQIKQYKKNSKVAFTISDFVSSLEDRINRSMKLFFKTGQCVRIEPSSYSSYKYGGATYEYIETELKKVFKIHNIGCETYYSKYGKRAVISWLTTPYYGTAENPNI